MYSKFSKLLFNKLNHLPLLFTLGMIVGTPAFARDDIPAPCEAYLEHLDEPLTNLSQEDFDECEGANHG